MSRLRRALLPALVAVAFAGLGAWVALVRNQPGAAGDDAVARLFALRLADAQGQAHALEAYRGRLVVLNFWATWCPPCVEEMPELDALQGELRTRGVQIIGIGIDSAANIARFAAKSPMQYPLLVGGGEALPLLAAFGDTSGALPYTVAIAPDGRIVFRHLGRVRLAELRDRIAHHLPAAAAGASRPLDKTADTAAKSAN